MFDIKHIFDIKHNSYSYSQKNQLEFHFFFRTIALYSTINLLILRQLNLINKIYYYSSYSHLHSIYTFKYRKIKISASEKKQKNKSVPECQNKQNYLQLSGSLFRVHWFNLKFTSKMNEFQIIMLAHWIIWFLDLFENRMQMLQI